ncbi:hypothetical protein JW960_00235 [candidate division KSB1 bacterium]|nr:hypothetical protein [candidate division KSB1 bacterium]
MKQPFFFLLTMVYLCSTLYAQKDTVYVQGYYESGGTYGTLNDAIETAINDGTINNTVFKLTPYEIYVLDRNINLDRGQNLELVAPKPLKAGDSAAVQHSAPPQIVWTEEHDNDYTTNERQYIIRSYGDIIMKNIWVRYADMAGNKTSSSIVFEDQDDANKPEQGYFEGCLFDYAGIGAEAGGTITVKTDHFDGEFQNCYFRNNQDNHFRYYGRAVSFPYESTGWHYDRLLFENCTFTNISRIVAMEGNEYGSNIHLNHCTVLNAVEWIVQSGWIENLSITNSIFVNPAMMGYRALDVCNDGQNYDEFVAGFCNPPKGGLIQDVVPVDSFGFEVDFTDMDRKIVVGFSNYVYQDWLKNWYSECLWCQNNIQQGHPEENYKPFPMLGEEALAFIDSTDDDGNKIFTKMNIDMPTIYEIDPLFVEPATNQDTLLLFLEYKWYS